MKKKPIRNIIIVSVVLLAIFFASDMKSNNIRIIQDDIEDINWLTSEKIQKEESGGGTPEYIPMDYLNLLQKEESGGGTPEYILMDYLDLLQKEESGGGTPEYILMN